MAEDALAAALWAADCTTAAGRLRRGVSVQGVLDLARSHAFIAREPEPVPCPSCTRAVAIIEEWLREPA